MVITSIRISILLNLFCCLTAQGNIASQQFFEGKKLIEANCADCLGSTRAGVEAGISRIEDAIESGYVNRKEAYTLLAESYNLLGLVFSEAGSSDQEIALSRRDQIYRQLVAIHPDDVEILEIYLWRTAAEEEKPELYEKILQEDPSRSAVRYEYGTTLLKRGDWRQGVLQMVRAVQTSNNIRSIKVFVRNLEHYLRQPDVNEMPFLCSESTKQMAKNLLWEIEMIESLANRAGYSRTVPVAVEEFKIRFEAESSYFDCFNLN